MQLRANRKVKVLIVLGLVGGVAAWSLAPGESRDGRGSIAASSTDEAVDADRSCQGVLPRLPSKFAVRAIATGEGPPVGGIRLLERGKPVADVLTVATPGDGARTLQAAEAQLRADGAAVARAKLGAFDAVLSRRPQQERVTVITRGPCRSYSIIARDERSARGVARELLEAETREVAGSRGPRTCGDEDQGCPGEG